MEKANTVEAWINGYGPDAAQARRRLVDWLDEAAQLIPGDRPELAVTSLAEMATMIAVAYPEKREELAKYLYMAADEVATNGRLAPR